MDIFKKMKYIIQTFVLLLVSNSVFAQTVREISISADNPYIDHFSLAREAGDMDVMIKFSFDEQNNQLIVSMTSYRGLFVFRDDVRYRQAVRFGKLRIDKLPYVVAGEEVPYKMPYHFKKQLDKHRKQFVFKRWLNYTGLLPEPVEYQMVNDVVEQKFGIVGDKRSAVSVTIGDVMIMEPKTNLFKKPYYTFVQFAHVDTRYNVTIERNPCFGMEEQISIAAEQVSAVTQAYQGLIKTFPNHTTDSRETYELFCKTKEMMKQQFPKNDTINPCPSIQVYNDSFNVVVDSVMAYRCQLVVKGDSLGEVANPSYILSVAYQIDMKVSRWLLTSDKQERADIIRYCNEKIEAVSQYVHRFGLHSKEMREANAVMHKAIEYYRSICHPR